MANTWTALTNKIGFANGMWLMQDGRVLVNVLFGTQFYALSPDSSGSYVHGTWDASVGNFLLVKQQFASVVLSDGRLITCGGENTAQGTYSNFCEVYDPRGKKPTSSAFPPPAGWTQIGDAPTAVLSYGSFILGNPLYLPKIALLDPSTLTWTPGVGNVDNEQGYVLLQTGDVLTVSISQSPESYRYDPSANAFTQDSSLPVALNSGGEIGPAMTLMDGKVIWFGATGNTCVYTPGAEGQNGSWVRGPNLADQSGTLYSAGDAPALLQPNGRVLVRTRGPNNNASAFMEYHPVWNTISVDTAAPSVYNAWGSTTLLLPNGHGLVSLSDGSWYDVTFEHGWDPSWAPVITSFPAVVTPNSRVILCGKQLCGLSECSNFGDDNQQAENYPMVRFVDSSANVTYARAHDVSTRSIAPDQSGAVIVEIPGSLVPGTYTVYVVAMGIPSAGVTVNVFANDQPLTGCVGDFDGDAVDEILVSSRWGIGILKKSGDTMTTVMLTPNWTRLGEWLLDTNTNQFGPVGDFDSDGSDEILVTSPWGLGYLKLNGNTLTAIAMTANGAELQVGVNLNTQTDRFGPVLSSDNNSIFYNSPAGVALVWFSGSEFSLTSVFYPFGMSIGDGLFWTVDCDNQFGPLGDFDGDGQGEIIVTSRSALGIIKLGIEWSVLANVANGTALAGGWTVDTTSNKFLIGGNYHYNLPGVDIILATSPWGIATLQFQPGTSGVPASLNTVWIASNGTDLGGWTLDTSMNEFGPWWRSSQWTGTFNDPESEVQVLVRSPWGLGIPGMAGITTPGPFMSMSALAMAANGTSLNGWNLDTSQDQFGSFGNYDGGAQFETFAVSPWGIGILRVTGGSISATMLQPNGTRLGGWLLDTGADTF